MTDIATAPQTPSSPEGEEVPAPFPDDFLDQLPLVESPIRRKRLARAHSFTRLISNTAKHLGSSFSSSGHGHSSWNDSITDITLGSSLDSLQENEFAAIALVKDLDQAIADETRRKARLHDKMENISSFTAMTSWNPDCPSPSSSASVLAAVSYEDTYNDRVNFYSKSGKKSIFIDK